MAFVVIYNQTATEDPAKPNVDVYKVSLDRVGFEDSMYYTYKILFDPEKEYLIAIDQSTSSTGIAIASQDFSRVAVFTVVCGSNSPYEKEKYIAVLLDFIERLLIGKKLKFFALEEVPPPKNNRMTVYKILMELKVTIENKVNSLPAIKALSADHRFTPYPQQWKSTVFDKKVKGMQGRFNMKEEIAKDIVKIYPALKEYLRELERTPAHDYDGFDAFGILVHVRVKHFNEDWELTNFNSQTQTDLYYVFMKYIIDDDDTVYDEFVKNFVPWAKRYTENGEEKVLLDIRDWVEDLSIYTNFTMAANTNKVICMEAVNRKLVFSYLIETGEKPDKEKCLWVAVCKAHRDLVTPKYFSYLEERGILCKKYYRANLEK